MKDYCKKKKIFFNEGERINFLSQRSKAQYKLYQHAFDHSTNQYLQGNGRGLVPDSSEVEFRKTMERLRPEKVLESKH